MAIRNFFGYDDVPMPTGEQVSASVSLAPLPFTFKPGSAVAKGGVTYTKDGGWLKCTGSVDVSPSGINKSNYTTNLLQELGFGVNPQVITIGVRWLCPMNVGLVVNWPHPFAIPNSATLNSGTIAAGSPFSFGSIPDWVAGKEYYLEAQYDFAALVIRRRVDGVPISDMAIHPAIPPLVTAGTARLIMGTFGSATIAGNIEYSFWFKDMYLIEKTSDGTADSFLGPQQVVPISVASLDQAAWLPTGAADPVTALNTAITDSASLATPVVTTDVANNIGNIGLSMPSFFGQVNGVLLNATGRRKDGASGGIVAQVTSGSDNSTQKTVALTNAMVPGYKLYLAEKSPSGVRWTRTALQAAQLKLTVA